MTKDARGADIHVGDTVIYVASGSSYTHREVSVVAKLNGKTKITLQDADSLSGDYDKDKREQVFRHRELINDYKARGKDLPPWFANLPIDFDEPRIGAMVDGKSVFVVTGLPEVEGRLNK